MIEFEVSKRLRDSYQKHCNVCDSNKHISKFKRFSRVRNICNDCANGKIVEKTSAEKIG
jgi:hypothetical protein